MSKSELFGVGVGADVIQKAAVELKCKAEQFPSKYLGVPLGANITRVDTWSPIIENFMKRLSSWKIKTLSIGGRRVLAQSVLGSIATYYLLLFKAPKSIIDHLERFRKDFF